MKHITIGITPEQPRGRSRAARWRTGECEWPRMGKCAANRKRAKVSKPSAFATHRRVARPIRMAKQQEPCEWANAPFAWFLRAPHSRTQKPSEDAQGHRAMRFALTSVTLLQPNASGRQSHDTNLQESVARLVRAKRYVPPARRWQRTRGKVSSESHREPPWRQELPCTSDE
eukprot:6196484-Pleurochrysis_carterae.AAC.4